MPRQPKDIPAHRRADQAARGAYAAKLIRRVEDRFAGSGEVELMFKVPEVVHIMVAVLDEMRKLREELQQQAKDHVQ